MYVPNSRRKSRGQRDASLHGGDIPKKTATPTYGWVTLYRPRNGFSTSSSELLIVLTSSQLQMFRSRSKVIMPQRPSSNMQPARPSTFQIENGVSAGGDRPTGIAPGVSPTAEILAHHARFAEAAAER